MRVEVDCEKIRQNAEAIANICAQSQIEVIGVTKACRGNPSVARAILQGGIRVLAESRLANVRRIRSAGIDAPIMLLRAPTLSETEEVVRSVQVSLNSEIETIRCLSDKAQTCGITHQIILMLEIGDLREGVMPEDVLAIARETAQLSGVELVGMGANAACLSGVSPSVENMHVLVQATELVERTLGVELGVVSGGNSSNLDMVIKGLLPRRINQLRIGEAILLGTSQVPFLGSSSLNQDAFTVFAEVIEVKEKPSLPTGIKVVNSFRHNPQWTDLGVRRRAVLALGEQDLRVEGLTPRRRGAFVVGASSDQLVLDVSEAEPAVHLGEEIAFAPDYAAVATSMPGKMVERTAARS